MCKKKKVLTLIKRKPILPWNTLIRLSLKLITQTKLCKDKEDLINTANNTLDPTDRYTNPTSIKRKI